MANLLAVVVAGGVAALGFQLCAEGASKDAPGPFPPDSEEPPSVALGFAGTSPRSELRLRPQPGARQDVLLRVRRRSEARMEDAGTGGAVPDALFAAEGGGPDPQALVGALGVAPAEQSAEFEVDLRVTEVAPDGSISLRWKVRRADPTSGGEAGWERAVAAMRKLRGEARISETGRTLEAEVRGGGRGGPVGAELETLLRRWFSEPALVLPDEPVGLGAVWRVERTVQDRGVRTRQVQRFELKDLRPERGRIEVAERDSAEPLSSSLDLGDLMKVLDPHLAGVELDGDGRWEVDLAAPSPLRGALDAKAEVRIGMALGPASLVTRVTTSSSLTLDAPLR